MLPGQVKNQLPILRKIQPAADLLDLAPSRANVQLLAQRNPHEVINRLKLVFADDLGEAHISRDVSDRTFPEVRHDLIRRSGGHHDLPTRIQIFGSVFRKRPLVEPVFHHRPRTEIVLIPVVGYDVSSRLPHRQGGRQPCKSCGLKEGSSLHITENFRPGFLATSDCTPTHLHGGHCRAAGANRIGGVLAPRVNEIAASAMNLRVVRSLPVYQCVTEPSGRR